MEDVPAPPPSPAAVQVTVHVATPSIGFNAAHFSVVCGRGEPIHGHNYSVALRARGLLRDDGTLLDFRVLKDALRAACATLDNRMLLPDRSPEVTVTSTDGGVEVVHAQSRRYLFPAAEVALLPVPNTTCECLAGLLLAGVRARLGDVPVILEVVVEETPGQGATVAETAAGGTP